LRSSSQRNIAEDALHVRRGVDALEIDQQVGVDQEGHGSPGGPLLSQAAASSAANASSRRTAIAINALRR
jgi:hypothetical protein